ncbi:hypothetical protein GCM10017620_25760 [Brevundimonas intermedia]|uniref:Oxidoreductase n=1 Tax=Brevundimonas intermedia TaxID=74315 RepID=A0ABQ5TEG0_9CAUL|nr:phage tail protein [Brevundimonas intermedia]GLK49603.1 hypothetical protein GCM10017620_25760 [Brevundimonas intermedia]
MLLALGMFDFSIDTALFNQLQRRRNWRHPSGDRVGARAASQYAGPGDDIIVLGGLLAPGQIGHAEALDDIALMAKAGSAYPLLDGEGYVYGAYVITDLDETKRNFLVDGQALMVDFTITLKRVDDDDDDAAGVSTVAT